MRETQTIIIADCLDHMRTMAENSIDCIVTDPPYGLNFMGKDWDHGIPGKHFWTEANRICKPGTMLLAFGGTRTFHRLTCAIEDAGWEIRDCLMWLYGSGFPKSLNISKSIDKTNGCERKIIGEDPYKNRRPNGNGWANAGFNGKNSKGIEAATCELAKTFDVYGTALKPAWEPIIMAMKPCDGTFAQNAEKWGLAGINIDECRIGTDQIITQLRDRSAWHGNQWGNGGYEKPIGKSEPRTGRWPSNLLLDEEAAQMLDQQSGIEASRFFKVVDSGCFLCYNPCTKKDGNNEQLRFKYQAKASSVERGVENNHPTIKPLALMQYLIKLVMPPNPEAILLDPFAGSGTTVVAAKQLRRNAIGIEISSEYAEIARKRIDFCKVPLEQFILDL